MDGIQGSRSHFHPVWSRILIVDFSQCFRPSGNGALSLRADVFLDDFPSRSDGTVETSWGPQATFAPFLQVREAFPDKPTAPPFNDLGDVAH